MNTGSITTGTAGLTAATLYHLAGHAVRFRYTVESLYADVVQPERDWPVPQVLDERYQALVLAVERAAREGGGSAALDRLRWVAKAVRGRFDRHWLDQQHRDRLAARAAVDERAEFVSDAYLDWLVLTHSLEEPSPTAEEVRAGMATVFEGRPDGTPAGGGPSPECRFVPFPANPPGLSSPLSAPPFGARAWVAFTKARAGLVKSLPDAGRPLFRLGTLLAEVRWPYPSSYDPRIGGLLARDSDHLARCTVLDVEQALGAVQAAGLLEDVPLLGEECGLLDDSLIRLDGRIHSALDANPGTVWGSQGVPDWRDPNLYYPGEKEPIRTLKPQAKEIKKVLKAFQMAGWPKSIYTGDKQDRIRDLCDSLNNGLRRIRFLRADGAGRIAWEPL